MINAEKNIMLEKMLKENRVIFPLTDFNMNITGFVGRNHRMQPYYLSFGDGFFGNCNTAQKTIIMVEGVLDVILAENQRFDNVIGFTNWKTFSDENIKALRLSGKNVIFFADSDNLGIKMANQMASKLQSNGIKAVVYKTDKALDLYDYMLKGYSVDEVLSSVHFN